MVDGEDGLEVPEQKLFDEFLEEGFEPVSHRLGFHDGASDALKIGEDGPEAFRELVDLVSGLSQSQRHLALLSIDGLRRELFDCFEIQTYRDDQASEPLRDILVQARQ